MTETAEAVKTQFPEMPVVKLDNLIGKPSRNGSKTLFSIRIPAEHQATGLSLVRMQNCGLTQILGDAKKRYRDMTKFIVPTDVGPRVVKLHFFIFPTTENEIQIDYSFATQAKPPEGLEEQTNPIDSPMSQLGKQVDQEIGQRIHSDASLGRMVSNFATIVHDLVCKFIDDVYYSSKANGIMPDYLVMTPPPALD